MKSKVVTIIAEIGQNHGGNMQLARKLIRLAKENGADLAKFQLYSTEGLERSPGVLEILRQGELSFDQAKMLFDFGAKIGIEIFFSVFDIEKVKWCEEIGVKRYKIASTMRSLDVLKALAQTGKDIIISGLDYYQHHRNMYRVDWDWDRIRWLYCISKYPPLLGT